MIRLTLHRNLHVFLSASPAEFGKYWRIKGRKTFSNKSRRKNETYILCPVGLQLSISRTFAR